MQHVWVLTLLEYMQGQHTGFDCDTKLIAIFDKKPDLATVSKHLKGLSNEMGEAISQVHGLLESGQLDVGLYGDTTYELSVHDVVQANKRN